jgi:hypothetical protein
MTGMTKKRERQGYRFAALAMAGWHKDKAQTKDDRLSISAIIFVYGC